MTTIIKFLKQKTTWAGLVSLLTGFGVVIKPDLASAIIATGMSVAGLAFVLFDEDKPKVNGPK